MNHRMEIAAELCATMEKIADGQIGEMVNLLADASAVFAGAAGRSGCMLKAPMMRLMHMGIPAYMIGEIATPAAHKGDVLLLGSGSGETETLKAIAAKAKKLGMKIGLVTISAHSSLGQLADVVVEIPAPTPKMENGGIGSSVQPMGSLFEQGMLLLLDSIVMDVMEKRGVSAEQMFTKHANLE